MMNLTRYALTPAPPEVSTQVTFYDFGGLCFASTGPRGGWSSFALSDEAVLELYALLKERLESERETTAERIARAKRVRRRLKAKTDG